nr:DUF4489 domain-containing protein [uncultured Clostridium sp.]
MYNCFFGMPFRRNVSYNRTFNKPHQPAHTKTYDCRQYPKNNYEGPVTFSATNDLLLKSSELGGIILPNSSERGATYIVASMNLDTSTYRNYIIYFDFSCNIETISARLHLRFQLFKQEACQITKIPVSANYVYARDVPATETNIISFTAYDCNPLKCKCCNYSVYIEVMGFDTTGTIIITNPVLFASLIEDNIKNQKGEL